MSSVASALLKKGCCTGRIEAPLACVKARVVRQRPLRLEVQALGIGVVKIGEEMVALSDDAEVVDREGKPIRGAYAMSTATFDPYHVLVPLEGEAPERALPSLAVRGKRR